MLRLALALLFFSITAHAQQYPDRAIRIIVPFPAGDGIDIQARTIGQRLTERWGQQTLVDNRPGAGTLIGTEVATRAAGDGYTILVVTTSFSINPSLHAKVPYDPIRDFAPLIHTTAIPLIVVASPTLAAKDFKEVMALARQKPNHVTIGNAGVGTAGHIGMALLDSMAGVQFLHVPYKGIPAAVIDLMSGQLQLLATSPAQVMGHIREGKVRAMAVSGTRRMPHLPEVPTVQEIGVEGYDVNAWIGMVVPAATPRDIVQKLNREIASILRLSEIRERLQNDGSAVVAGTPEEFGAHIRSELARWEKVIRTAGIKPQ